MVIPGEQAPPEVHAAAYTLNAALGAVGKTVVYTDTVNPMPSEQVADLKSLVGDMNAGKVQWLVMLGVNPMYAAPVDLEFAAAFEKVPNTAHLGSHVDETGAVSVWHMNKAHYLESWSDARVYDGTISIIQPMIAPMYGGHSAHDVLQALLDNPQMSAYDAVQANAKTVSSKGATLRRRGARRCTMAGWTARRLRRDVEDSERCGCCSGAGSERRRGDSLPARSVAVRRALRECGLAAGAAETDYESELGQCRADELMQLRKVCGATQNDAIKIEVNGRSVIAPVLVAPGHADGAVTVHLGFGRRVEAGRVGAGVGFPSYLPAHGGCAVLGRRRATGEDRRHLRHLRDQGRLHRTSRSVCAAGPEREGVRHRRDLLAARARGDGARNHPLRHAGRGEGASRTSPAKADRARW